MVTASEGQDVLSDEAAVRAQIENWAVWRDVQDWERFTSLWHPDARIVTTWFVGSAARFIELARTTHGGPNWLSHHELGGSAVIVANNRAFGDTRMTLHVRTQIDGVACDIKCLGRFFDLFEKVDGEWKLYFRHPIYEKDRLDPVQPGSSLALEDELLSLFPSGYAHLAYAQEKNGMKVNRTLPGNRPRAQEPLYRIADSWLAGENVQDQLPALT